MSEKFIELERTFHLSVASGAKSDDVDLTQTVSRRGQTMTWSALLTRPRVVILSGGGSGKTVEIRHRARLLHDEGRPAFFLRIEHVRDDFSGAFDKAAGNHEQFLEWASSGDQGWVFLDSVDEARLRSPKEFEQAIIRIGSLLKSVLERVHIVITGREAAWRALTDRELIRTHLPYQSLTPDVAQAQLATEVADPNDDERHAPLHSGDVDIDLDEALDDPVDTPLEETQEKPRESERNAVLIVSFDPLDEKQVESFVRAHGVTNVSEFMRAVERREAHNETARPLDLEGLVDYWKSHGTIGGQFELTDATISRRLDEVDQDRAEATTLSRERLREGARVLAAANLLMQAPDIRLRGAPPELKGVEPAELLNNWSEPDIRTLLLRPLFVASNFGAVRLYVQKAREFLTAEWLHHQLVDHASRARIEALLFRTQYGREVVVPSMRGVLPWLASLDPGVLARVRRVAPEVMFEGGDPSRLPSEMRRELLSRACQHLAGSVGRNSLTDFQAVQRFAADDLADQINSLLTTYQSDDEIAYFLMRMVWQGEIKGSLKQAKDLASNATDFNVRLIAMRAVALMGNQADRATMRTNLLTAATPPDREWIAEAVESLPRDEKGVSWLLEACIKGKRVKRHSIDHLPDAIETYISELPASLLPAVVAGLAALVAPSTDPDNDDGTRGRQPYDWLMGAAIVALDRLVQAQDPACLEVPAMALLLRIPAEIRFGDNEDRKDSVQLGEHVASWPALNNALFWADVEGTRARRLKKSKKSLVDIWGVGIFGHYWRMGSGDFDYLLKSIETRPVMDDQKVALSAAYALIRESDRPAPMRQHLKRRVKGKPELEGMLTGLLGPPSDEVKKWRRQEASWKRRSARDEARRLTHHVKWRDHLQANLIPLRTPHPEGGIRQSQYYLSTRMREFDKDGSSRWTDGNWAALIPEFGVDVAEAFRDGAIAFWRTNTPQLLSTGATPNSTPVTTVFGLTGLLFESRQSRSWATGLAPVEADLAARYAIRELNGFPPWLPKLFGAHPDQVIEVVLGEIDWELQAANSIDSRSDYVLSDVSSVGSWLWPRIAPELLKRLASPPASANQLRDLLSIVSGSPVDSAAVAAIAQKHASTEVDQLAAIWFATWLGVEPELAIPTLEKHLAALPDKTRQVQFAMHCLTVLTGGRLDRRTAREGYRTVPHLTELYLLMHRHIRESEDLHRAGGGVYSPELRDDAQDARDALLVALRDTPGQETYFALLRIAEEHPSERGRAWAARLAQARAIADADRPGMSGSQAREFLSKLERKPRNASELFDLAVERLLDLKHALEHGETSQARLLLTQPETAVRNYVADWLTARGLNRYAIAQEEERAEGKRTDVRFTHIDFDNPVPIELKLANEWSGSVLVERLKNQLCNDYLRDEKSSRGVFLLVYQGGRIRWDLPDGTRVTSLDALTNSLQTHWAKVAKNFPHVHEVQVIGIDLTLRAKPVGRASKKKTNKQVTKRIAKNPIKKISNKSAKKVTKKTATQRVEKAAKKPEKRVGKSTSKESATTRKRP